GISCKNPFGDSQHMAAFGLVSNGAVYSNYYRRLHSKATFSHSNYAALRPSYPPRLYDTVLAFHKGPRNLLIDLGSGHGLVARYLSKYFDKVIGTDPSVGMIQEARSRTSKEEYPNVDFIEASAESLPFAAD